MILTKCIAFTCYEAPKYLISSVSSVAWTRRNSQPTKSST